MDASTASRIVKHLTRPVSVHRAANVELWIAGERQSLAITRPTRFDRLSLVSSFTNSSSAGFEGAGIRNTIKRWICASAPPLRPSDYFLDTRIYEPNNVSHLLLNVIPLCLLARKALGEDPLFIFRPLLPRYKELLSLFGIRPVCTRRPARGLGIAAYLSREIAEYKIDDAIPDCPMCELVDDIYDGITFQTSSRGAAERLFISRKGARSLTNETEVKSYLEPLGFQTVYFEELTITEQIAAILGADEIVCVHGAAMGYLALKERIGTVVELLPPNVYHNLFPVALGYKTERYFQLVPTFDGQVQFSGWDCILRHKQRAFRVDMAQLQAVVPR